MRNMYGELAVLRGQNRILQAESEKLKANQDYIAIMCDVDLEEENEQELRED